MKLRLFAALALVVCVTAAVVAFAMIRLRSRGLESGGAQGTPGQIPVSLSAFDRTPDTGWLGSGMADAVPFSIESRRYRTCFEQRVVFGSGKVLPLYSYAKAENPTEVYSLGRGEFYLLEGWGRDVSWQRRHRVNVSNETLEVAFDKFWIRVPDGARSIVGMSADVLGGAIEVETGAGTVRGCECVPVGDSLASPVHVGTCWPDGRFARAGGDGER